MTRVLNCGYGKCLRSVKTNKLRCPCCCGVVIKKGRTELEYGGCATVFLTSRNRGWEYPPDKNCLRKTAFARRNVPSLPLSLRPLDDGVNPLD